MYALASREDRDQLVSGHMELVRRIAYHMAARLPESVQVDDLIQAGVVGLLEAATNYESGRGASFATFAGIRIRGAMLDEIRRYDWTPRSVHRNTRRIAQAMGEVEGREGRAADAREVASALEVDLDTYHRMLRDVTDSRVFSLEEIGGDDGNVDELLPGSEEDAPEHKCLRDRFREALAEAIMSLPERERLVLSLYYDDELNLREIGEVLGVTESRVCQLHGQSLGRLRARMSAWTNG